MRSIQGRSVFRKNNALSRYSILGKQRIQHINIDYLYLSIAVDLLSTDHLPLVLGGKCALAGIKCVLMAQKNHAHGI